MAHPTIWMGRLLLSAFATAKVLPVSAVFGKTNEYHVMPKSRRPWPTQLEWAATEMRKNQIASLTMMEVVNTN